VGRSRTGGNCMGCCSPFLIVTFDFFVGNFHQRWLFLICWLMRKSTCILEIDESYWGEMGTSEAVKNASGAALGIVALIAILSIPFALLYGAASASVWAIEYLPTIFGCSITISSLIITPLAFIPASRGISGNGFVFVSYAFWFISWLFSMAYVYLEWGFLPLVIGILMGGVGVVPIAFILSIFDGAWGVLGNIFLLTILTFAGRGLGFWLIEKAADREFALAAVRAQEEIVTPASRIE
jgi:hypothetical protein